MKKQDTDQSVLKHIQSLAAEEHQLYLQEPLGNTETARLKKIQVELDQCWDLLRQRQARRSAGQDPNKAHVRSPKTVENYE
ncbi:MAG TPA: DUF2630 family protein [Verrucomicrobiae bacterium]|nr:DUF2630 family protein [Verrucomicrobiae bacterium]